MVERHRFKLNLVQKMNFTFTLFVHPFTTFLTKRSDMWFKPSNSISGSGIYVLVLGFTAKTNFDSSVNAELLVLEKLVKTAISYESVCIADKVVSIKW